MLIEPGFHSWSIDMSWIEQGDECVHIEQNRQGLILFIAKAVHVFERDQAGSGAVGEAWDSSARFGRRWWNEALTSQFGKDLAKGFFLEASDVFGDAEDVFVDVDSSSHGSRLATGRDDVKMT